jgi:hypothetical protein
LAVWIFVLSLAGVSPELHASLHAHSDCAGQCPTSDAPNTGTENHPPAPHDEEHFCGVVALQSAESSTGITYLPEHALIFRSYLAGIQANFKLHSYQTPLQARAPPFEI